MSTRPSPATIGIAAAAIAVLSAGVAYSLYLIPAVKGLGSKVKLPMFHGASTWVDLMLFILMGIVAVLYLVTRKDSVYAWEVGLRSVAAPLWVINSVLGLIAALSTWDFTGSLQSPLTVVMQDPRLVAQMVLLVGVAILILLHWLVLEKRTHKAIADIVFVIFGVVLLSDIFLDPAKRALHPDSPVLNSGVEIQAPFFGIVAGLLAISLILAWLISRYVGPESDRSSSQTDAAPVSKDNASA